MTHNIAQKSDYLPIDQLAGLGSMHKKAIVDRNNLLWITTNFGVFRFDGNYYTRFSDSSNQLRSGFNELMEIGEDSILVTCLQGLGIINKGHLRYLALSDSIGQIRTVAFTFSKKLLVGTDSGLYYFNYKNFYPVKDLNGVMISSVVNEKNGNVLVYSSAGIYRYSNSNGSLTLLTKPGFESGMLLSAGNGFYYTDGDKQLLKWDGNKAVNLASLRTTISAIKEVKPGRLRIIANAVYYYENGRLEIQDSLRDDYFKNIVTDMNNEDWAICYNYIYKGRRPFYALSNEDKELVYSGKNAAGVINKVWVDAKNEWWIQQGTDSFNLYKKYRALELLNVQGIYGFYFNKDGSFYASVIPQGYLFFTHEKVTGVLDEKGMVCTEIYPDKNDNGCWMFSTKGIVHCNGSDYKLYNKKNGTSVDVGILCSIIPDPVNNWIWCHNLQGEFFYFDTDKLQYFRIDPFKGCVTTKNNFTVGKLLVDKNNDVWFYGVYKGLYKLTRDKQDVTKFHCSLWDPEFSAGNLNFDVNGNLWVHGTSLMRIYKSAIDSAQGNSSKRIDIDSRIELSERNSKNIYFRFLEGMGPDTTGVFVLHSATSKNIYKFYLNSIFASTELKFPPVITAISLNQQKTNWEALGYEINNNGVPTNLRLLHNQNNIGFYFSTISSVSHSKTFYRYKLINFDTSWKNDKSGFANFTNLASGVYTFEVCYSFNGYSWSNPAKYYFTIQASWWTSWWFLTCMIGLFGSFIFLYIRFRTYNLKNKKIQLEKIIQSRTVELENSISNLESSNKQNELFISVLAHDIKGPARFCADVSESLTDLWGVRNNEDKYELALELKKTTKALYSFLTNFLTWLKQKNETQVLKENINMRKFFEEIFKYHKETGNCIDNQLIIETADDIILHSNKKYLEIIISNLVDNACKYTRFGIITLSAYNTAKGLIICCADTGKGMTQEQVNLLLAFKGNELPAHTGSFKMGYLFIRDLIGKVGAEIRILSEVDNGTKVSLLFNLQNNLT